MEAYRHAPPRFGRGYRVTEYEAEPLFDLSALVVVDTETQVLNPPVEALNQYGHPIYTPTPEDQKWWVNYPIGTPEPTCAIPADPKVLVGMMLQEILRAKHRGLTTVAIYPTVIDEWIDAAARYMEWDTK